MLTSFKRLRALMSYYGRQMTCRSNAASPLVSSGHDNRRIMSRCPRERVVSSDMLGFKVLL